MEQAPVIVSAPEVVTGRTVLVKLPELPQLTVVKELRAVRNVTARLTVSGAAHEAVGVQLTVPAPALNDS